jgi:hypothetical protein
MIALDVATWESLDNDSTQSIYHPSACRNTTGNDGLPRPARVWYYAFDSSRLLQKQQSMFFIYNAKIVKEKLVPSSVKDRREQISLSSMDVVKGS